MESQRGHQNTYSLFHPPIFKILIQPSTNPGFLLSNSLKLKHQASRHYQKQARTELIQILDHARKEKDNEIFQNCNESNNIVSAASLIPWNERAADAVLQQVRNELEETMVKVQQLQDQNKKIKSHFIKIWEMFRSTQDIIEFPLGDSEKDKLEHQIKKIESMRLKERNKFKIPNRIYEGPLMEEFKLKKYLKNYQQFQRAEVDQFKEKYRGIIWADIREFREKVIPELNSKKNMYYIKICLRNIYVRCRRCKSFQLRFNFQIKNNMEVNIVFNRGTTYHIGSKH